MTSAKSGVPPDLAGLALEKMTAVLGSRRAGDLLHALTLELQCEVRTPQDLYRFAQALARRGGFEGAVGAMLGVTAVMRGAGSTSE